MSTSQTVTCLTWNIHRAKGADGRIDPCRVEDVLLDHILPTARPQIMALQEADREHPPHEGILDIARIERGSGLQSVHGSARLRWSADSHGFLGTILFLAPSFATDWQDVIDLPGHCHRGAVVAEIVSPRLRVISMHLSLSQALRIAQMRIIGQYLLRRPRMQTIILGDLNEWRPWGGMALSERLIGYPFAGPTRATFPASFPMLPLDRILSDRQGAVGKLATVATAPIRAASDHLPLFGDVAVKQTQGRVHPALRRPKA